MRKVIFISACLSLSLAFGCGQKEPEVMNGKSSESNQALKNEQDDNPFKDFKTGEELTKEAFSNPINVITGESIIDENGYVVKVSTIEFFKRYARIKIAVTNNTSEEISFYNSDAKAVQESRQFDEGAEVGVSYQKVQTEILPGVTSEGYLVFDELNPALEEMTLFLEGTGGRKFKFDLKWGSKMNQATPEQKSAAANEQTKDTGTASSKPTDQDIKTVKSDDARWDELVSNYEYSLIDAINANDFSLVEYMLLKGSSLYEAQKKLVANLNQKGISEELVDFEIKEIKYSEQKKEYYLTVREKINIIKKDGESTNEYTWMYTVKQDEQGMFKFSEIKKP